jgi:uncharacterized membrane protein YeiH
MNAVATRQLGSGLGFIGYHLAYATGQLFREGLFQFMTAFSLPWYAIVGAQKGVSVGLPVAGCLFLALVGPTTGRWLVDVSSGVTPKQFIRGEWFIGTALLTGLVWILLYWWTGNTWVALALAFAAGFTLRTLALFMGWEEPLPKGPAGVVMVPERRPLLGRKLKGKSEKELRDLGLLAEEEPEEAALRK